MRAIASCIILLMIATIGAICALLATLFHLAWIVTVSCGRPDADRTAELESAKRRIQTSLTIFAIMVASIGDLLSSVVYALFLWCRKPKGAVR